MGEYDKNYIKINFNTDDDIPLNKEMYFLTITVIIRNIFEKGGKYYPQIFFRWMFVWSIKMLQYERISEGIDFDKTNKSVECMIGPYWYFKDIGFKYQPYVCNRCHDFSTIIQKLDDLVILRVKGVNYRCCVVSMSKKDAVILLNNSVPDNKGVL